MIRVHGLDDDENTIDLREAIRGHSADCLAVYKRVEGETLRIGFYLPRDIGQGQKRPLFVFIHGGGWSSRKIFEDQPCWQGDYLGYLARYFAERGFVCASLDYRLARDEGQAAGYGIIECYEDCCDAMDYVTAHGKEYGIDASNMYLLGESAGGQLAGGLAAFRYDRRYSFRKIFLVNPVTHFSDEWSRMIPVNSSHLRLRGLSFEERAAFLSPLHQLRRGMGQVVLIHGKEDMAVKPEHSMRLYERMLELGEDCSLHFIQNTGHAFLLAEYTGNLRACRKGIAIIEDGCSGSSKDITH